jgi:hypothetical protein
VARLWGRSVARYSEVPSANLDPKTSCTDKFLWPSVGHFMHVPVECLGHARIFSSHIISNLLFTYHSTIQLVTQRLSYGHHR